MGELAAAIHPSVRLSVSLSHPPGGLRYARAILQSAWRRIDAPRDNLLTSVK